MATIVSTLPSDLSLGFRSRSCTVSTLVIEFLLALKKVRAPIVKKRICFHVRMTIAQSSRFFAVAASLLLVTSTSFGQSFSELEERLYKHPSLQVLSYQADSTRALSESALGLPDPIVSFGINNFPVFDPSFDEFLPTNKAIGIQQQLPSRSGRKARSATAQAQAAYSGEMRKQLYATMRGELVALLHTKALLKKQVVLAQKRDVKYDQLIETVETEVDAGRPSVFRLAEIEAERAEVSQALVDLAASKAQVDSRLIYLVGSPVQTMPPKTGLDGWSGEPTGFNASRVASALLSVSEGYVAEAESAWKPQWGVQLSYHQREAGSDFDGDDWVSAMVTFSVPFWAKKKQAPRLRAAKAAKQAALATVNDAKRQASAQYSMFEANYLSALASKDVLEKKIRAIEGEIQAQRSNYESGAGYYAPVIDGEITILALRSEMAAQETRSEISAAQMNSLLVIP